MLLPFSLFQGYRCWNGLENQLGVLRCCWAYMDGFWIFRRRQLHWIPHLNWTKKELPNASRHLFLCFSLKKWDSNGVRKVWNDKESNKIKKKPTSLVSYFIFFYNLVTRREEHLFSSKKHVTTFLTVISLQNWAR